MFNFRSLRNPFQFPRIWQCGAPGAIVDEVWVRVRAWSVRSPWVFKPHIPMSFPRLCSPSCSNFLSASFGDIPVSIKHEADHNDKETVRPVNTSRYCNATSPTPLDICTIDIDVSSSFQSKVPCSTFFGYSIERSHGLEKQ